MRFKSRSLAKLRLFFTTLFAALLTVALHGTSHAIEVTNESYCVFCNSYDPTLPAQPRETADYATELQLWMNKTSSGTTVTKEMAQSMLGVAAQPLGDEPFNEVVSGTKKGPIYSPTRTIKAAIWDMIVAEYLKKAVVEWDKELPKSTTKNAYSKATQIQQKFREIQEKEGGPDIPAQRNALLGSVIGFGTTSYGDLYRSEGVLENKIEGAIIERKSKVDDFFSASIRSTLEGVVNLGDLGVAISTVMKASSDQKTQDAGYLLGTITTGTVGLLGGGATLVFAPAQILADTFDKLVASLDDAALEVHFLARYILATRYVGALNNPEMMTPEGVLDFSSGILHTTFNGADPLERGLLTSFDTWKGVHNLCKTEDEKLCLDKTKLASAYALADFFALVRSLNFDKLTNEFANYSMVEYIKANSFQLDAANKVGVSFNVSIPEADSNQAKYTNWFWPGGTLLDFLHGTGPVLSGTLTIAKVELYGSQYQKTGVGEERPLIVWVSYPNGMSRRGSVILKYLPEGTSTPPTNQAPVLRDQSLFVSADKNERIFPNFTDDGDMSQAYVTVTTNPSCGIIADDYRGVFYIPFEGTTCSSDQFKWFIRDDRGLQSNEAVVNVTFVAPSQPTTTNTAPVAAPVAVTVVQGKSVPFFLQATDAEQKVNDLVFTTTSPKLGTLKPTGIYPNEYVYTHPPGGSTAGEVLTYTVSDGSLETSASLTITVTPPPDYAPYAKGQIVSVSPGQRVTVKLDGGDEDLNDQPNLVYSILTQPTKGTASISGSTLTYEHTAHDALADSLQWQVKDTVKNGSAKATLAITVVNRQPVIGGITNYSATSGQPVSVNLSAIDPDGGAITWKLASGSPGQISGNIWTHTFTQSGTYSIKVIASDPYTLPENSPSRTFTVIVDGACNFADVPASHANRTTICAAAGKQWIVGYTENSQLVFKPNQAITRGEFSKLVFKFLEETSGLALTSGASTYPDVPSTHGLFAYIQTLTNIGLLKGYSDGSFKPDQAITRAEMSLIINRLTGWGSVGVDTLFKDVPLTAPAGVKEADWLDIYFAVGQLANHGIVSQTVPCAADATSVCFRPNDGLTRLEGLLVLERLPGAKADQLLENIVSTITSSSNPAPLCTLIANPPTISAGSSATLTATCTPAATSYTWTGGTCNGQIIPGSTGNDVIFSDNSGVQAGVVTTTAVSPSSGRGMWIFNTIDQVQSSAGLSARNINGVHSDTNNLYNFFNAKLTVTFKGVVSSRITIPGTGYRTSDLQINQAIKQAINNDSTLKEVLLAEDGPVNSLIVKSLIDGVMVPSDLTISLALPAAGTLSTTDVANAAAAYTRYGLGTISATEAAVLAVMYGAGMSQYSMKADYATVMATDGFINITGAASTRTTDIPITPGIGSDIIVLSTTVGATTAASSNETIRFESAFGNDVIFNFSPTGPGFDTLDFSALGGINLTASYTTDKSINVEMAPPVPVGYTAGRVIAEKYNFNNTVFQRHVFVEVSSANPSVGWVYTIDDPVGVTSVVTRQGSITLTGISWLTGGISAYNFVNASAGTTSTSSTCTVTPSVTTSYTVTGVNTDGTGNTASATVTVNTACSSVLSAASAAISATSSTGNVGVTSSCNWTAASNVSWIIITSGTSGSGNGTVAYTVAANTGTTARTGTLTISGKTFTVTQAAEKVSVPICTLNANPSRITPGGSSTLTATCNPTATSYIWTGGTCAGTSAATCTVSTTVTTTYSVTGTNTSGTGTAASATVTVTSPSTLQPNADGTVTDPKTGLTWMRCAMGQTWTGSTCSGTARTYTLTEAKALTGIVTFAGTSDWRLPNIRELQTIVDRSVYNPAIDSAAFPNTPNMYFWSDSSYANSVDYVWGVGFNDGVTSNIARYGGQPVRLVRGGQSSGSLLSITRPTSDYVDNGNGTVTHTPTNLTWKRCAEGQTWTGSTCSGTASTYTFDLAKTLAGTAFAGQSDWRVPTEDELVSLVDYSIAVPGPTINSNVFPATPGSYFWSSSPYVSYSNSAWYVYFSSGSANSNYRYYRLAVRLVRGGQSLGSLALTISKSGTGTGTVTSTPAGINCGSTCSASFASGASITLTATPTTGSTFAGWSGACTGTGSCTVSMTEAKSVTATFALSVTASVCTLSASPSSITAGGSSTLTATCTPAATSYTWTGGTCAGTTGATCTVTPTATTTYTVAGANAGGAGAAASATVTIASAGAPICTLSANPASITAGGSSTLTATCNPPATGYIWTGGTCAGTTGATCTVKPTATTTYSVQGSNTSGTNQAATATVTVAASTVSYTVPGTLGNDVFVLTAGNNYYGGAGNDTYIISANTLRGDVTAKIVDSEGDNLIQLVDGMTVTASSFYADAAQLTLSTGAKVQLLGASKFKFQVGANAPAGDTAAVLSYADFVSSLGASLTSGTLPASGTAGYVVPTGFTQASAPTPGASGSSYTVPGTLGDDVFVLSGGNNYLGGGGNDTYIISPYTLSGAVTGKIIDSEGANVIQLVKGMTIASSSFFSNAVQLTLSNGAKVQILGASSFSYQLGANAPAGETASSLTYAQFAAMLGASVPTGTSAVSGSTDFVVP